MENKVKGNSYFPLYSRKRFLVRDIMFISDAFILLIAAIFSYFLRFGTLSVPSAIYLYVLCIWIFYFLFMISMRAYTRFDLSILRFGIIRLTASLISAYALFFSITYFFKTSQDISRLWMGYNIFICLVLLASYRFVFAYILFKTGTVKKLQPAFAIIYSPSHKNVVTALLSAADTHRITVAKSILLPEYSQTFSEKNLLSAELCALRKSVPDVLILALSNEDRQRLSAVLPALSAMPSEILEFSSLNAEGLHPTYQKMGTHLGQLREWVIFAGLPFIRSATQPISSRGWWLKRLEDIVLGTLILGIFSPIMLLIAMGIKITSPGPVFYRQKRHGFNGNEIKVLKFRSMYEHLCDSENIESLSQAKRGDPRTTPLGVFLRKTSLDELPQLFNVLKGEMSLVGPRPHATAQYALYQGKVETYFSRHRVRPGITGWAQVNGWRGETDTDEKIQQRIAYDLYYIRHWSIWFDIRILFLTMLSGFSNKNAF